MSTISTMPVDSKSAKKRKAKAENSSPATPAVQASAQTDSSVNGTAGGDGVNDIAENSYLKELSKNIRNLHKKISASSKADAVVRENPGVSLDDLMAQKKLNADQKAQLVKKPQLQAQLAQLEEQQKHFESFALELEDNFKKEKQALLQSHEGALVQARAEGAESAASAHASELEQALQVISGFLHAAAAKRQSEDTESDETRAFEGALLLVYQGNASSLDTLKSLIEGADEKVLDTESNLVEYTFAQIKEAALGAVAVPSSDAEVTTDSIADDLESTTINDPMTDPTIANAGLTELEDTNAILAESNGNDEPTIVPEQASIGDAANAVAEASWDPQASVTSAQTATGDDWIQVPRDPAETESGTSQPAVQQSTTNWADEAGAAAEEKPAPNENDGFEQVRRDRGGRGRGPRGRGFDGRGRGRGRGEGYRGRGGQGRGGRGAHRGERGQSNA